MFPTPDNALTSPPALWFSPHFPSGLRIALIGNRFAAMISRCLARGGSPLCSSEGTERVSSSSSVSCVVLLMRNIDRCLSCSKRSTRVELSRPTLPTSSAASMAAAAAAAAAAVLLPKSPSASALPSVESDSSCRRNSWRGPVSKVAEEFSRDMRAMSSDARICLTLLSLDGDNVFVAGEPGAAGLPREGRSKDGRLRTFSAVGGFGGSIAPRFARCLPRLGSDS